MSRLVRSQMKRARPTTAARRKAAALALLRVVVYARDHGRCVRCSTNVDPITGELHHRQLRSRGGPDSGANCLWLCPVCHVWVHANVTAATVHGYLCPSWEDPALWPVRRHDPLGVPDGWGLPGAQGWTVLEPEQEETPA